MKQGDTIVAVNLVDLAITLFTLGVTFYDPRHPYIYQSYSGKRSIKFHFNTSSAIHGVPETTDLMKSWRGAEDYPACLSPVSICKRVVWIRRNLLKDLLHRDVSNCTTVQTGCTVVTDMKLATIAYALGFEQPADNLILFGDGKTYFQVGSDTPQWLKDSGVTSLSHLHDLIAQGIEYIEAPGNDLDPVALAHAMFLNSVAWLDHLKTDKPYLNFKTSSGKAYWVKEGSDKWQELLELGYSPL